MSPNPLTTIIDRLLDASKDAVINNKVQNRGIQLKPRIIRLLEERQWKEGSIDELKYIEYEDEGDTCLYFSDCKALPEATIYRCSLPFEDTATFQKPSNHQKVRSYHTW